MKRRPGKSPSVIVFLLTFALFPAQAIASPQDSDSKSTAINPWSIPQKIIFVGLTPSDNPTLWKDDGKYSVNDDYSITGSFVRNSPIQDVRESIDSAMDYWIRQSRGEMKFDLPKFVIGKPGTAIAHCSMSQDQKIAMKLAKLKSIPKGTRLVIANVKDTCGYSGIATIGGNALVLKDISADILSHELGHNFNFLHSSSVLCENNDYSIFTPKNCEVEEYGDSRDLMGNASDVGQNATLSGAQRATVFGIPLTNKLKIGRIYTVDESRLPSTKIVYELKVNGNWYFFEYFVARDEDQDLDGTVSRTPEIQVRMLGPLFERVFRRSVGLVLVTRKGLEPGATAPALDEGLENEYPMLLTGFKAGEKFNLPGTSYYLNILETGPTSARFSVTKS